MATEMVKVYFEELIRESDQAWFIFLEDGREIWFPKSQCELDEDEKWIDMPDWLAFDEGLS